MRTGTVAAASTTVSPIQLATPTHGVAAVIVSWFAVPLDPADRLLLVGAHLEATEQVS
jgi:hypothetical protein